MFTFNLQSLLNHRGAMESALKKELAESERALEREREKLRDCREMEEQLFQRICRLHRRQPEVSEIRMLALSHGRLADAASAQEQKVAAVQALSDQKRDRLVDAMKKRKILDRLKEKQMTAYRLESDRKEQALMSELAMIQFNRNH